MNGRPCLCSVESIQDYVVVNLTPGTTPKANDQPVTHSWTKNVYDVKRALLSFTHLELRQDTCCQKGGWKVYDPNDHHDDCGINAKLILIQLDEKIQECRQTLSPPITQKPTLKGYKFTTNISDCGDKFQSVYFLWIQAGENFFLYLKAGLMPTSYQGHSHAQLLRLTSKEDKLCAK